MDDQPTRRSRFRPGSDATEHEQKAAEAAKLGEQGLGAAGRAIRRERLESFAAKVAKAAEPGAAFQARAAEYAEILRKAELGRADTAAALGAVADLARFERDRVDERAQATVDLLRQVLEAQLRAADQLVTLADLEGQQNARLAELAETIRTGDEGSSRLAKVAIGIALVLGLVAAAGVVAEVASAGRTFGWW
jgi:hypothetical protein